MARRPCRQPDCPELVVDTAYCPTHTRDVESGIVRGRRVDARYSTKRWKILARHVCAEQGMCALCVEALATIADHILAVEDGGPFWARANLQGICASCHGRKTNAEVRAREFAYPASDVPGL